MEKYLDFHSKEERDFDDTFAGPCGKTARSGERFV